MDKNKIKIQFSFRWIPRFKRDKFFLCCCSPRSVVRALFQFIAKHLSLQFDRNGLAAEGHRPTTPTTRTNRAQQEQSRSLQITLRGRLFRPVSWCCFVRGTPSSIFELLAILWSQRAGDRFPYGGFNSSFCERIAFVYQCSNWYFLVHPVLGTKKTGSPVRWVTFSVRFPFGYTFFSLHYFFFSSLRRKRCEIAARWMENGRVRRVGCWTRPRKSVQQVAAGSQRGMTTRWLMGLLRECWSFFFGPPLSLFHSGVFTWMTHIPLTQPYVHSYTWGNTRTLLLFQAYSFSVHRPGSRFFRFVNSRRGEESILLRNELIQ